MRRNLSRSVNDRIFFLRNQLIIILRITQVSCVGIKFSHQIVVKLALYISKFSSFVLDVVFLNILGVKDLSVTLLHHFLLHLLIMLQCLSLQLVSWLLRIFFDTALLLLELLFVSVLIDNISDQSPINHYSFCIGMISWLMKEW